MPNPLITAVMITGKHPDRIPLAVASVNAFVKQSYDNRQLLIVTDGFSLLPHLDKYRQYIDNGQIQEMCVPQAPLGALRNAPLNARESPWFIQWDDDDWSGPDRMSRQMELAQRTGVTAVTLKHQIRYSFTTDSAVVYTTHEYCGIHGTILHKATPFRYEEVPKHEDSRFVKSLPSIAVLDNSPSDYIRFYHGNNTWNESHIMGAARKSSHTWRMSIELQSYLRHTLKENYEKCYPSE